MITDMSQGKPFSVLCRYTLPMLISVAFQQIYNIADSVIAGRYIGEDALAAIGASYPITMLFIAVATGMNSGCSVVISQQFGMKNYKSTKTSIFTAVISTVALSLVLTLVGVLLCNKLMVMVDTPENIFNDSAEYLRIYIYGVLGLFIYNICNAAFNSLGDSKTPLMFLIISSVGNIILDIVFIKYLGMGVAGAAWATLIAQHASAVASFATLLIRLKKLECGKYELFSSKMLIKIMKISIPSILQQSFVSVGNIFIQRLVNGYGSTVIAGYSSAIKLNTFAVTTMTTVSTAMSNFTAQNIGAGKTKRVKDGFVSALTITLIATALFTSVYIIFRAPLIELFLKKGDGVGAIAVGEEFMKIVAPFYLLIGVKLLCDGVLRGAGLVKQFMVATFLDLLLRVLFAFIFSNALNSETGIWMSWPIGWGLAAVCSLFFYFKGDWKTKSAI